MAKKIVSAMTIERPLIFLCGPYSLNPPSQSDRRDILLNHIIKKYQERDKYHKIIYQPLPIVVDEILNPDYIDRLNLSLPLMEEIVSAVSFHTFIFLDTISTSMELGLFSNSSTKNMISVFIPIEKRKISIGEFVNKSIENNEMIERINYHAIIDKADHVSFEEDKLPSEISQYLETINTRIKAQTGKKSLSIGSSTIIPSEYSSINFNSSLSSLDCFINFRTLFYLVTSILKESFKDINESNINAEVVSEITKIIKNKLLDIFIHIGDNAVNAFEKSNYLFRSPKIRIYTSLNDNLKDLVLHICHLMILVEDNTKKGTRAARKIDRESFESLGYKYNAPPKFDVSSLLDLTSDDLRLIESYNSNANKYVRNFYIKKNGKLKKITTYSADKNGFNFRKLHEKLSCRLKYILPSSDFSYAYKKNLNIVNCINPHMNSNYFYKFDIESYFKSIKLTMMTSLVKCILMENPKESIRNSLGIGMANYEISKTDNHEIIQSLRKKREKLRRHLRNQDTHFDTKSLRNILSCCFFKYTLPIGYVTSPLLSDFFLNTFDQVISEEDIVYSRYADDILISSTNLLEMSSLKSLMIQELLPYGLSINHRKCISKKLVHFGDSIRFLGVNIVNSENGRCLTVSKGYLLNLSLDVSKYLIKPSRKSLSIIKGKLNYIHNISDISYKNAVKIIHIKNGISIDFIEKNLV